MCNNNLLVKTLNQFITSCSLLNAFNSVSNLCEFALEVIKNVPYVEKCSIYLIETNQVLGDKIDINLEEKLKQIKKYNELNEFIILNNKPDTLIISLTTLSQCFGCIIIKLSDYQNFEDYKNAINNFSNSLANKLENLKQIETLENYNLQLKLEVDKKTEELKKSINDLKIACNVKNMFLANINHELRTPLNIIMGFNDLLMLSSLNNDQIEYCKNIKSASLHLLDIINDILDFSNLEANKVKIQNRPFNIIQVVENAINQIKNVADKKNIKIHFDNNLSNSEVIGDKHYYFQILINLLLNAIKFTSNDGFINIKLRQNIIDYNRVVIIAEVEDNGIGIPPEKLNDIFEMFYQIDDTITKRYSGIGLGLSIVKHLVKLMNGNIYVQSELNKGSKFTVEIPFEINSKIEQPKYIPQISTNINYKPKVVNVLIVEDEEANGYLIEKYFKTLNWNVTLAKNGDEAIKLYKENNFDVVIMDIHLPIINGCEATKIIRQIESNTNKKHTPIIAFTAFAIEYDRDMCIEYGADDYLNKPINLNGLKELVLKYIKKSEN